MLPDLLKNIYLDRYAWPGPIISSKPAKGLKIIVVIPCYHETGILEALNSLYSCRFPDCKIEVIVVINHGENESSQLKTINHQAAEQVDNWGKVNRSDAISCKVIRAFDLPRKTAGVGLARKIGMDEAVRRFEHLNEKKGIIVCFDADCRCSDNYLMEIYQHYVERPETNVALMYFEHPTHGELPQKVYDGIVDYELHLRYYKNALKFAGFPFSYHTIGSCITVSSQAYQKQGGMNQRKAGEDFYFLQKIFPHGHIYNIQSAMVIPSPRPSKRVPFGTGRAVNDILSRSAMDYQTYNPKTFIDLKTLIDAVGQLYGPEAPGKIIDRFAKSVKHFLEEINFSGAMEKIKNNSTSEVAFQKSFYQWFNGFSVLKFVHFARDHYHKNTDVSIAANWILQEMSVTVDQVDDKKAILALLRKLDRSE